MFGWFGWFGWFGRRRRETQRDAMASVTREMVRLRLFEVSASQLIDQLRAERDTARFERAMMINREQKLEAHIRELQLEVAEWRDKARGVSDLKVSPRDDIERHEEVET